jgi:metal-responsive CopG/Arc/MetJ family transcriptional regulator
MKRTTISLDEELLRKLKSDAAAKGVTLAEFVNSLLRQALAHRVKKNQFKLQLKGWKAEIQPGVDILDRDKLFNLINGR